MEEMHSFMNFKHYAIVQLLWIGQIASFWFSRKPNVISTATLSRKIEDDDEAQIALEFLRNYDRNYIERQADGRRKNISPIMVEMLWMNSLGETQVSELLSNIRRHIHTVRNFSDEVVLGIKAESGVEGLEVLREWTKALQLPTGILRAFTEDGSEIPYNALDDSVVYIKYNSTDSGNACMKEFHGKSLGVIFQAIIDSEFFQVGDLPLRSFHDVRLE